MNILAICGSLRKASYNRRLIEAAVRLAPEGMTVEIYEGLREIPPFDQDQDRELPPRVAALKDRWEAADGILVATPEYNYGPPGVLKNAFDWLSRPPGTLAYRHKPIALMGASPGFFGTTRAQLSLRQMFASVNADVLLKPEIYVMRAMEKFDENGELIDADAVTLLGQFLEAFRDHVIAGQHAARNTAKV